MKKTFALLLLLLTASLSLSAQSLDGTWRSYQDDPDNPNGQFWYFTFAGGSSLTWKITTRYEDAEIGQIDFSYVLPCTYERVGNILKVTTDVGKIKMNIDRTSWSQEAATLFYRNPDQEKLVLDEIRKGLDEGRKSLASEMDGTFEFDILDLADNTLMLKEDDTTMTFVRYNK